MCLQRGEIGAIHPFPDTPYMVQVGRPYTRSKLKLFAQPQVIPEGSGVASPEYGRMFGGMQSSRDAPDRIKMHGNFMTDIKYSDFGW